MMTRGRCVYLAFSAVTKKVGPMNQGDTSGLGAFYWTAKREGGDAMGNCITSHEAHPNPASSFLLKRR